MKWFIAVGLLFAMAGIACAGVGVREDPIKGYGTPETVSISTSAWTKVPTSQASGRLGFFIDIATTSVNMAGHLGDCSSTSVATTVRPLEFISTAGHYDITAREDVCLWILSLHTSAQNVHVQEYKK